MEPTPPGGVLDDLAKQLFGTQDPAVVKRRRRQWDVATWRSIAFDVAIILGLAISIGAYLAFAIWLWMLVF